jgi:glycosyltransferase involved in cell wall biosynthesis
LRIGYCGELVNRTNHGVGNCILELGAALRRRESTDELLFYVGDPAPWLRQFASRAGTRSRLVPAPVATRALRGLRYQLVLPRQVSRDGIDVLHATGYVMPLATRVPTVLGVFDLLALTHPELCRPAARWHYRALLARSIRAARRVVVPSRAVRDQVCERLGVPAERVTVVAPGVRQAFRRTPAPAELDELRRYYALHRPFVLFVGNLEPKKNLARLLRAHQDALRAGLEGDLVLAGGRGWRSRRLRAREGLRWLGYVPAEDLPGLYRLASEVAFPSLAEGFGLPVVEALACGAVVVASQVPAVSESDPQAVVRIEPSSVSSITEGLLRARGDEPLRKELAARGPLAVRDLSWGRAAARVAELYREVVAG